MADAVAIAALVQQLLVQRHRLAVLAVDAEDGGVAAHERLLDARGFAVLAGTLLQTLPHLQDGGVGLVVLPALLLQLRLSDEDSVLRVPQLGVVCPRVAGIRLHFY